ALIPIEQLERERGVLQGQVFRSDGTTPARAVPVATDRGGVALTDQTGSYRIEDLPAGPITVRAIDQGTLEIATVKTTILGGELTTANLTLFGGTASVRGTVVDAMLNPVANAVVAGGFELVRSDASGAFLIPAVPLGQRSITALDQQRQLDGSVSVNLTRPGEEVEVRIILEAGATVVGTVFASDGVTPLAGLRVFLLTEEGRSLATTTDENGAYRFEAVPVLPRGYTLSAFRADFSDGQLQKIKPRFDREVLRADVWFRGKGTVTGTVFDDDGQTPLGARVGLTETIVEIGKIKPADNPACLPNVTVGDVTLELPQCENVVVRFGTRKRARIIDNDPASGRFSFENVFVGPFTLEAANAFSPEIMAAGGEIPEPRDVVDVTLQLSGTSKVEGTVYQVDGVKPAAGVLVRLESSTISDLEFVTGTDGRYEFPVAPAGGFSVTAEDTTQELIGRSYGSVEPGRTAEVPIRLLGRGALTVEVVGANGEPLADSEVVVTRGGFPAEKRTARTPASGVLVFDGADALTEGRVSVKANDPLRGVTGFSSGTILVDQNVSVLVEIPNAAGAVEGRFLRGDRTTGIPNAQIVLKSGGREAFATTDENGGFLFEGVLIGAFTLEAFDPVTGRRGRENGRLDADGQTVTLDIDQIPQGIVLGDVVDSLDDAPLSAVELQLRVASAFGDVYCTSSGVDGRYRFPVVSAGDFTIQAVQAVDPATTYTGSASGSLTFEGEEVELEVVIQVPELGRVEGRVLRADGLTPSAGAQVTLFLPGVPSNRLPRFVTDAEGRFLFENVPTGTHRLLATVPPADRDAAEGFASIAFDGDRAEVDLGLAGTGTVTGLVKRGDGSPEPFAALRIQRKGDEPQLYNLNIPTSAVQRPRGVRVVPMSVARYGEHFIKRSDPKGRTY
ncbi:MAG: hypothetical protein JSV80_11010, partial [Acidobacteriota bacterium]